MQIRETMFCQIVKMIVDRLRHQASVLLLRIQHDIKLAKRISILH